MDEFPNELLLQIFSLLHTPITCFSSPRVPAPSRDLLALCRVCRSFRDVARSLIYESIERAGDMNSEAFRQLPRTLLKNVELCRYIKSLRLKMEDGFEVGDFWAGHDLPATSEHMDEGGNERLIDNARCIRYQRRHRCDTPESSEYAVDETVNEMPEPYGWLSKLISAMDSSQAHADDHDLLERAVLGEDVLLTPCVLSASNLERLWIRLPRLQLDGSHTSFLFNSLAHSAYEGGFERLRLLHLDIHQSGLEWPVRNALPFFLLPNLIELTLGNCGETNHESRWSVGPDVNDSTFMGQPWTWPVRGSPITRLTLLSPRFSGSIVAKMILACRAVTEFEVVLPYHDQPRDSEFFEHVEVALVEHADTLIKLSFGDLLAAVDRSLPNRLGVFRMGTRLTSLTFLRATPHTLLGYDNGCKFSLQPVPFLSDALPTTIEHLWFDLPCRPWNMSLDPYFAGLYQAHQNGKFPRLKSIYIHWHQKFTYDWDVITHFLRDLMYLRERAMGITFDICVRIACATPGKIVLIILLH